MTDSLAERLRAHKNAIIDLAKERKVADAVLPVIEAISERLQDVNALGNAGSNHGTYRANIDNFSIGQLLDEYRTLTDLLLDVLGSNEPLSSVERDLIWKSIGVAMEKAATAYVGSKQ